MTDSVFQGRSLLSTRDYTKDELMWLIGLAEHLKDLKRQNIAHHYLEGKNIVLLFEKTSTRTRAAFTTACICSHLSSISFTMQNWVLQRSRL